MPIFKFRTSTPPFRDSEGQVLKDSLAEATYLTLGGLKQWVLLRGKSIHNPILIFLHGGPGISVQGLLRYYNSELENHFLVVGWDQRGTGKSYSPRIDPKTMNIPQFISDLHELIQYLKDRFQQDKVYLMGESWGSLLGALYAYKYPQDILSYVGVGQVSDVKKSEKLSYEFALTQAKKLNHTKAIRELNSITSPGKCYKDVKKQRKWLVKFGGMHYGKTSLSYLLPKLLSRDEYALPDIIRLVLGSHMSLSSLWPQVFATNLFLQVPKLKVPAYFLLGRHDKSVSTTLAAEYFDFLEAPYKKLIYFEESGHNPFIETPQQFNEAVIAIKG